MTSKAREFQCFLKTLYVVPGASNVNHLRSRVLLPLTLLLEKVLQVRDNGLLEQKVAEVGLHPPGAHEVNAGLEHPEDIQEWLQCGVLALLEQSPFCLGESTVVMSGISGDAPLRDAAQLFMGVTAENDER